MPFVGPAPRFANPPDAGQQAASPPAPAPSQETPLPPPAPGWEAREVQGEYAPQSLAQLVGTLASSTVSGCYNGWSATRSLSALPLAAAR
jgi:hypothetical protein